MKQEEEGHSQLLKITMSPVLCAMLQQGWQSQWFQLKLPVHQHGLWSTLATSCQPTKEVHVGSSSLSHHVWVCWQNCRLCSRKFLKYWWCIVLPCWSQLHRTAMSTLWSSERTHMCSLYQINKNSLLQILNTVSTHSLCIVADSFLCVCCS